MTKQFFFLLLIFFQAGNLRVASAQLPPANPSYKLIFNDEFESEFRKTPYTVLDSTKWDRSFPWRQSTNKSGSMAAVDSSNPNWDIAYAIPSHSDSSVIKVSDGTCKLITAWTPGYRGETWDWPSCDHASAYCDQPCKGGKCFVRDTVPFQYTTGMLWSKQKFRYGYFEIRFRIPSGDATAKGFGPCCWLWGTDVPNGIATSEIDIFEISAFKPKQGHSNHYTTNAHFRQTNETKDHNRIFNFKNIKGGKWNTAAVWWTPSFIRYYFNNKLIFDFPCAETGVQPEKMASQNLVVETNSPATNFNSNFDPQTTKFPYIFEIDYIRVYQEKK